MNQAHPKKPFSSLKITVALIMVVAILWAFNLQRQFSLARQGAGGLPFRISKEVTLYTDPLTDKGGIDYLKIMNERLSKSDKRSDNAALLLFEALGDGKLGREWTPEAEWLGVDEKKFVTPPFVTFGSWASDRSLDATQIVSDFEAAMSSRWETTEFPQIATWLNEMRPSLERVSEAANAPQFFIPIITQGESPYGESRSPIFVKELASAFAARAQLRLQVEDYRKAWEDVVTIYRLGKLLDQSPSLLSRLIGYYILERANVQANLVLANAPSDSLDWVEIRKLYVELASPNSLQELSAAEHDYLLHLVSTYALTRQSPFRQSDNASIQMEDPFEHANGVVPIDWSIVMTKINQEYAELDKILADSSEGERLRQLVAFSERAEVEAKEAARNGEGSVSASLDWFTPKRAVEKKSDRFAKQLLVAAIPDFARGELIRRKTIAVMNCQLIASEVHFFHKKFGRYPESLAELESENQTTLPVDSIRKLPFEFMATSSIVSIYTLGEDGKASVDPNSSESDDWGVRFLIPNMPDP